MKSPNDLLDEAPHQAPKDPRRDDVGWALIFLACSTVFSVCSNFKTEWRQEFLRLDKDTPGFASSYAGTRVNAYELCYTIGSNETCHSYTKPSLFNSINKTDGSVTRIVLTGCQLLDDGPNMYGTQIPFSGGFARFLRRFCDSRAPSWAPWIQFAILITSMVALGALLVMLSSRFGRRFAVPLAWTATVATCGTATLHLANLVGWGFGLGFNAMGLGGCFYAGVLLPTILSLLGALKAWHAVGPTEDAPSASAMEPLV